MPQTAEFALVSFEGPDPYSSVGALGARVSSLARTLAELGFRTHLFFIGDPNRPAEERGEVENLTLHRWSQWISAYHPGGAYDGEEGKARDLATSLPPFIAHQVVIPALAAGRVPIVLFEEWQTAECACRLSEELEKLGMRDWTVLFWNANHRYGFDRIDWPRLARSVTVTAVSTEMRLLIADHGVDAEVIPSGIPMRLLSAAGRARLAAKHADQGRLLLFKMARWNRQDGWRQALDALVELRGRGKRATLVARAAGPNGAGAASALSVQADRRGLKVTELCNDADAPALLAEAVRGGTDVINLRFRVSDALARMLYASCDAVLANAVSEPFGRVGLEAMAAGAVVITGGAGAEYAVSPRNAIVLETLAPVEIADRIIEMAGTPARASQLRRAARATARLYTWPRLAQTLLARLEHHRRRQDLASRGIGGPEAPARAPSTSPAGRRAAASRDRRPGILRGDRERAVVYSSERDPGAPGRPL